MERAHDIWIVKVDQIISLLIAVTWGDISISKLPYRIGMETELTAPCLGMIRRAFYKQSK